MALFRAFLYLFLTIAPLAAQTISPAPAADDLTLTVLTGTAAKGDILSVHTISSGTCDARSPQLPLVPHTNNAVLDGGVS